MALLPRLDRVISRLAYRHEVLRLSHDIGQQTRTAMEGRQREFLLREQLKAIQKELGESDDASPELEDLKRKLEQAGHAARMWPCRPGGRCGGWSGCRMAPPSLAWCAPIWMA